MAVIALSHDRGVAAVIDKYIWRQRNRREKMYEMRSSLYSSYERGFSLVEVMIAIFILTFAVLGLASLTLTSIQMNMQNSIRNTAVRITTQTAEMLLAQDFGTVSSCGLHADSTISGYVSSYTYSSSNTCLGTTEYGRYPNPKQFVGVLTTDTGTEGFPYNITWTVSSLTGSVKEIAIKVEYKYKNIRYENNAVVYKHQTV